MRETLGEMMRGVAVKDGTKPKRVANNTVHYIRPDGAEVWRLHHTDIVIRHANGQTELNSGGWRTSTTKDRINSYSPARLYQEKGEWFLSMRERANADIAHARFWHVPFTDGMRVNEYGEPIGYKPDKVAKELKARAKLAKEINRFSRLILDAEAYPEIPMPDGGDCWFCLMFDKPKPNAQGSGWNCNNLDTAPGGNTEHLLQHMKENYLHGSLIFNALAWAGYKDPGFLMHTHFRDHMRRALRRYLRRRLGLG